MISVVVISKDEPMLGDTLGELSAQELDESFEVVVVDASCGRLDTIRRRFPDVTWIDYPASDQITIAAQRNRGMGAAAGRDRRLHRRRLPAVRRVAGGTHRADPPRSGASDGR